MNVCKQIAQHLLDVHTGQNWTEVNLKDSLQSLTHSQVQKTLPHSPNSIAMLVHHILFWNQVVLKRILGIDVEISESNGFEHPPIRNDKDWKQLIKQSFQSANALAEAIENFDENKLFEPLVPNGSTAYKTFHGQVEHVHYHLGQIVLLAKGHLTVNG